MNHDTIDTMNTKTVKRVNRSRSNSPANSLDSSRRRSLSNNKKKMQKSNLKSKEDVQVFTSLPPKVDGEIKCYLRLKILKINYIFQETTQNGNSVNELKNKKAPYPNREKYPLIKPPVKDQSLHQLPSILAKCVWWGEDQNSNGAIFRPKIFSSSSDSLNKTDKKIQTTAKYMVRSGPKQFQAYLNDMKTLDIFLLKEDTMESIGKVQLFEIQQLSFANPIKGYFSAFDKNQMKIGEVYLSIQLESLKQQRDDSIESNASRTKISDMSMDENENPNTKSKLAKNNISDFNSKYEIFEQDQLQKYAKSDPSLKKDHKFYSESYETLPNYEESILKNDNLKNPLITNLIERGNKLKNEMLKSSSKSTTILPVHSSKFNYLNSLVNLEDNYDFIDSDTNEFVSTDEGIHDFSGLLTDPDLLSALLYTQTSEKPSIYEKGDEYDKELEDLLQPKTFGSKSKKPNKVSKNSRNEESIFQEKSSKISKFKQENEIPKSKEHFHSLNRSLDVSSNGSIVSEDETDENNDMNITNGGRRNNNFGRVSFELQSSDGESGFNSLTNTIEEKCTEILSPQRLSLLNLIQVAKLKIEKINLFSTHNASLIISKVNKIEQQNQRDEFKMTNKSTKPPIPNSPTNGRKNETIGQSFFIEYQFPVTANTRDSEENNNQNANVLMATQIMRVNTSKKYSSINTEENLIFENLSEYSVLFNSYSLETWWKSSILFKVYCRPSITTTATQPHLIGIAKLDLKNVLKSRNFKLYKKLAIYDQFLNGLENKRIGTLHIKIELCSDLKGFNSDLTKLKNLEAKTLNSKIKNSKKNRSLQNSNNKKKISSPSPAITKLNKNTVEDYSLPIQMFLSINEGRGFGSILKQKNQIQSTNIFLICRLFWNKEKVKFDVENYGDSHFSWTLNLSLMMKPSMIENMRNNFMIIEAWEKNDKKDSFIGTVKLPLNEFYLKFKEFSSFRQFLKDDSLQPSIGVDGWIGVCDPFTGKKAGEINVLLAMGSNEQILNLQKMLFDKVRIRQSFSNSIHDKEETLIRRLIEHRFVIKLDNLKLHPIRNTSNKNESLPNEADCFIKYNFPIAKYEDETNNTKYDFEMYSLSTKLNRLLESKQEHKLTLNATSSLAQNIFSQFRTYYKLDDNSPIVIQFEVWSRIYYPNCRDQLIAKGELAIEKLISIVDNAAIGLNNRSFVLPLVIVKTDSNTILDEHDKYIGQLFLTIEYSAETINYKVSKPLVNSSFKFSKDELYASLSVGILRATGLQIAFENSKDKENSSVYVKFSLNFLNKPQESKSTRTIKASLNGYSPEFFDYFDIKCPLISTYNSNNKRAISLAEQLEMGQVVFEIWQKSNNDLKVTDTLLGTCVVPLESLLDNRIGIRGWFSIRPFLNYSANVLENILKNESNAGGIEIAIRFTKSDDFLRIINTAKEIGWTRDNDVKVPDQPMKSIANSAFTNLSETHFQNSRQKIKCLIEIEKAVHLASVFDEKLNKHTPPNACVTFSINLNDPSEIAQTSVHEKQSSPSWNYQLQVNVDSEYFIEDGKTFLFKVWHKQPTCSNKLLGHVAVDMQPLICGLNCISGWYNIQDSLGNSQGQLKINILPQESLFALKQLHDSRKKSRVPQEKANFNSSLNRFNFVPAITHQSATSQKNGIEETDSAFSIFQTTSNLISSNSSIVNLTSLEIFRQKESKSDLKTTLMKKLSELDELNKNLKERLEKKANRQNNDAKENNVILDETPVKLVVEEQNLNQNQSTSIDLENLSCQDNLQDLKITMQSLSKTNIDKSESINQCDSFWIEPINNTEIEKTNLNEGLNLDLLSKHSEKETSDIIYSDYADQNFNEDETSSEMNEIQNNIVNMNEKNQFLTNVDLNLENANDTDLDQTFNLNGSYEISPTKIESPFEIVNKIIDCTELDKEKEPITAEEEPIENKNENHEDNYLNEVYESNKFVFMQTTTTIIADFQADQEDLTIDQVNEDINEDNLTIVIPEELNKITSQHEEIIKSENNSLDEGNSEHCSHIKVDIKEEISEAKNEACERFKELSSKLPNYFLAEKELEISMKQLHKNFNKMNMVDERTESQIEVGDDSKLTSKDLLFKNEKFLKQDFDRINKIFHSKFS